ncbi:hypothetical protein [Mycoplasmoides genitalium]|uniref:hypothetical protein n=1 Tax=Mycoplasmoides genitalium TaxID=2097 RepID=UPI0040554E4B
MENKSQKKVSDLKLITLWIIVIFGYLLFVVEWFVIDRISGKPTGILTQSTTTLPQYSGWLSSFFTENAGQIATSSTNWTITFLRAVGSILCGVVVLKFGYRYAVLIMMGIMCVCFPFLIIGDPLNGHNQLTLLRPLSDSVKTQLSSLSSNLQVGQLLGPVMINGKTMLADGTSVELIKGLDGNSIGTAASITGYALFIIFRSTIAIGGTTLVVYTQPAIANLSSNRKKSILSNANLWGFNIGIAVVFTPFLFEQVQQVASQYWVYIMTVMILVVFANLCLFLWFESKIDHIFPQKQTKENMSLTTQPKSIDILKNKTTWKLIGVYGIVLILIVNPLTPAWFSILQTVSPSGSNGLISTGVYTTGLATLAIFWVIGYALGFVVFSPFNKTIYDKKRWMHFLLTANIVVLLIIIMFAATLGIGSAAGFALISIFSFIGGAFAWSLSSSNLILPYEFKDYKKNELPILFGFCWGFGYIAYTLFDITQSVFLQAPVLIQGKGTSILPGVIVSIVFFLGLIALANLIVKFFPACWIKDGDQLVQEMTRKWKLNEWQFVIANKQKNRYSELLK